MTTEELKAIRRACFVLQKRVSEGVGSASPKGYLQDRKALATLRRFLEESREAAPVVPDPRDVAEQAFFDAALDACYYDEAHDGADWDREESDRLHRIAKEASRAVAVSQEGKPDGR